MAQFKPNALDTLVFAFHSDGLSVTAAHQKLVKLAGSGCYTLEEVEALYRRINAREFSLKENGEEFDVDMVAGFPKHLNKKIVEFLDVPARASLRKTCHFYRNLVDGTKFRIKHLKIMIGSGFVSVNYGKNVVAYHQLDVDPDHFIMRCNKFERMIGGSFFGTAMNDLKSVLMNQKLQIDKLDVRDCHWRPNMEKFIGLIHSLETNLKVGSLSVDLESSDQFPQLLKCIDADTIKTIQSASIVPRVQELDSLPQWKAVKRFEGKCLNLYADAVIFLSHFETCFLKIDYDEVTVKDLMNLKDKLLLNPNLNQYKLRLGYRVREHTEMLLTAIQQFKSSPASLWACFDYPNSKEMLALCVKEKYIWFKGPCFVEEKPFWVDDSSDDEEEDIEGSDEESDGEDEEEEEDDNE